MPERKSLPSGTKSSAMLNDSLLSSPPRVPPSQSTKERRNPSVTPKRFGRFFTPRSRVSSEPSAARKALHALAGPALNRCPTPSSSPLKPITEENNSGFDFPPLRNPKRRKTTHHTPSRQVSNPLPTPVHTSPLLPTPDLQLGLSSPIRNLRARRDGQDVVDMDMMSDDEDEPRGPASFTRSVPLRHRGFAGELAQRMAGGLTHVRSSTVRHPVADWRTPTADFYSRPDNVHLCKSQVRDDRAIPFCTSSCHNNSLVAVGDEEGYVRLLDSNAKFSEIHLSFPVHSNAIIDLDFSEDDYLLATAAGDQTGKVVDMMTQQTLTVFDQHTASLKQVRFQPGRGGGCVLATSARDGTVQIWDLRCRGPVQEIPPIELEVGLRSRTPKTPIPGAVVGGIYNPHFRPVKPTPRSQANGATESARATVTALQFLPQGREHLLLTACEADSSIKLWDIRAVHTNRHHRTSSPVSSTAPPPSHTWRYFGISAMTLNGDGSRLYSVCKDNTVYAYSTAHLVLGSAPELTPALPGQDPPRRRLHGLEQVGLGPMYGFRHPQFHATSFYIKTAVRPARDGREELLAVGSSDGCAVLFPTDERFVSDALRRGESVRPSTGRLFSASFSSNLAEDETVPLIQRGTPLVRGHDKEVGALTWTNEGKLVTAGDDYFIRCWKEDREEARDLRTGGETEGRRWGCGWADVGESWDGDQEDWKDADDDW
ncbi:hypothetical protein OQA88_3378 [Cercophora sp. LCS_1]